MFLSEQLTGNSDAVSLFPVYLTNASTNHVLQFLDKNELISYSIDDVALRWEQNFKYLELMYNTARSKSS